MVIDIENIRYKVVVNHEEQYALWIHGKQNALGWKDTGIVGTKSECLSYINEVWTDMRPLSLRKAMTGMISAKTKHEQVSLYAA